MRIRAGAPAFKNSGSARLRQVAGRARSNMSIRVSFVQELRSIRRNGATGGRNKIKIRTRRESGHEDKTQQISSCRVVQRNLNNCKNQRILVSGRGKDPELEALEGAVVGEGRGGVVAVETLIAAHPFWRSLV